MHEKEKLLVIGLGVTGYSTSKYLASIKHQVDIFDTRDNPPYLNHILDIPSIKLVSSTAAIKNNYKKIFLSPGVDPKDDVISKIIKKDSIISNDIGIFIESSSSPIIGVTGSNGKSTAVDIIQYVLKQHGIDSSLGGNFGNPVLDFLPSSNKKTYILELSSFQLEVLDNIALQVACVLNVCEDHMDRYSEIDEYAKAKKRIYSGASYCVANKDDPRTWPDDRPADIFFSLLPQKNNNTIWYEKDRIYFQGQVVADTKKLSLTGEHNITNAMATLAILYSAGYKMEDIVPYIYKYKGLEHRFEYVKTNSKITFINDSKATNVGAVVAALKSCKKIKKSKLILIAGGDAKCADLSLFIKEAINCVDLLLLIGKDANNISKSIGSYIQNEIFNSLELAVNKAKDYAREGDIVILSPACSSLDMFDNYKVRGQLFKDLVAKV